MSSQGLNYCCPVGASIINNACGCNSSGTNKTYVAIGSNNPVFNIYATT